MADLKDEFKYYVAHQDELVAQYNERAIVLKGGKVLGDFNTLSEAYWWAQDEGVLGTVMIHLVGPGEENYTTTIHSGLMFAGA
jgi:hypothetical protein